VELFPPIEPYDHGLLHVGDGQDVYVEQSGNPEGMPVVMLHGGPGSGCSPGYRRLWDPEVYRIVCLDQRGSGRSRPRVAAMTDLSANTTSHLLGDIERLREHLGIDRWLVFGGSWGSTLALAYAEACPERVTGMILISVTMTRPGDVHWLYHEVGRYLPEVWDRFRAGVPEASRDGDLVAAYDQLLNHSRDPVVREAAALAWCEWEDAVQSLEPGWVPSPRYADPTFRITFARLCAHYFSHAAWLRDGQLLEEAHRLAGIPGILIHGRFDLGSPADVPWLLARAWPDAELHLVATGHSGGEEMTERYLEATHRFAEGGLPGKGAGAG
jgi:proline iminopeptidase